MKTSLTVTLPKKKRNELERLAVRYGLSLPEFFRRVLKELASEFPKESFTEYENPRALKRSLGRALRDWAGGRTRSRL